MFKFKENVSHHPDIIKEKLGMLSWRKRQEFSILSEFDIFQLHLLTTAVDPVSENKEQILLLQKIEC